MLETVADVSRVNKGEVPSPSPEKAYSEVSLKLSVGTCIIVTSSPTEEITVSVDGGISAASGRSLVLLVV